MNRRMLPILAVLLGCCSLAKAEDAEWSAAFDTWKAVVDEAEQRVHAIDQNSGRAARTIDQALSHAEQSKADIEHLGSSLRERAGDIDSAKFNAKFAKDEFESAKRDADRLDQQIDQKAQNLKADIERLTQQSPQLDERSDKLKAQSAHLDEWHSQIESRRHVFQLPGEQGALDAFNADVAQYNAERDRYMAERDSVKADIEKWNDWRGQLMEIRKLIVEDGRQVLQLRQVESKKEQEYAEKQQKLEKLTSAQDEEAKQLAALLGPSQAALQGLIDALDTPAPVQFSGASAAGQPYARQDDATATAVGLQPSDASDKPETSRLRDRIFVLPPSGAQSPEEATAAVTKLQVRMDLSADDLAGQYHPVQQVPDAVAPTGAKSLDGSGALSGMPAVAGNPSSATTAADGNSLPALDPRRLISRGDYEAALAARDRLSQLLPKLQAELEKVRAQRGNTLEYENEFEQIRAEAARGALRDVLGTIPVTGILKKLADSPKLAASLTPEVIARVDLAMKAVRMEIGREHADLTPETAEQRKQRIEVIRQGAEALLSVCANEVSEGGGRTTLEQMGKLLQVYQKFSDYRNDPDRSKRPPWQELGEVVKTGIGIAGVYCAPVAIGAGIESLGERAATRIIIRSAMDDLSDSLKSNYDADRFLSEKIDRTQGFLNELNGTVDGYRVVHGPRPPQPQPTADPGT